MCKGPGAGQSLVCWKSSKEAHETAMSTTVSPQGKYCVNSILEKVTMIADLATVFPRDRLCPTLAHPPGAWPDYTLIPKPDAPGGGCHTAGRGGPGGASLGDRRPERGPEWRQRKLALN